MNYRHHYHAGNFADVMKHVLVLQLVRSLQQKLKGFLYLDSHAGRGAYDLSSAATGDSLARTPEWPDGIGRLWTSEGVPPSIGDYLKLIRQFDRVRGNLTATVRFYPGSPALVAMLARDQDRLVVCEKHPAEWAALKDELRRAGQAASQVVVQQTDGYLAIRALLPPPERRALVLIDPPYEAQDEFAQVADALEQGLKRFPTGVFALWYPLTERARVQDFFTAIVALQPPPTVVAELGVAPDHSLRKMKGCGLMVVNPPWRFEASARESLDFLAALLAQEPGGAGRVEWLVPEK